MTPEMRLQLPPGSGFVLLTHYLPPKSVSGELRTPNHTSVDGGRLLRLQRTIAPAKLHQLSREENDGYILGEWPVPI